MVSRPYPKIETLFERDDDFKVDTTRVRHPAFASVSPWIVTEKVDGTNVRLDYRRMRFEADAWGQLSAEYGGRTARAQIQPNMRDLLDGLLADTVEGVQALLDEYDLFALTIYGEGYGAGIQKGGGNYRPDPGFVAFDMLVNDKTWLSFDDARSNALRLGLDFVPLLGVITVAEAVERVRDMGSTFGSFHAEGVVAQPLVPLHDNRGRRVIWKLKGRDL